MLLIINGHAEPFNELMRRFWFHQTGTRFNLTPSVLSVLDSMKSNYSVTSHKVDIDLSHCINNNFQLPGQHHVLNFICQTKLKCYPSQVQDECIAYFNAIADDRNCVTHIADMIIASI